MTIYQELAKRIKAPESKIIPRLFEILADETDAKILLALPGDVPALTDKLGFSPEDIEVRLNELYLKGVVFPYKKVTPTSYRMAGDAVHMHDTTVQWKEAPKEFLDLWQEWIETEFLELTRMMGKMLEGKKSPSRIISANIWVESKSNVLPFDSIKDIVNNAKSLAVLPCACRLKAKKCDHPLEVCIVLNKSADYNIERGTGRKIDAAEALEIFKMCEDAGLVHLTGANSQTDPGPLLCNCCPCCCMGLAALTEGIILNDPSRFSAEINGDLCSGCGICHDRCYFDAITWENEEGGVSIVNSEKCYGCGLCQNKCPEDAIELIEARPKDFIPETGTALY
ncbi:MAG: ferredoxin family protein [Desulfobacteraceae bacterium]|jgi:NAD-dependent dihydropyrimidine dehydrogenase PreA subunit|nr:ferredoxin family protein [Desulfobacteraceae bacterium]